MRAKIQSTNLLYKLAQGSPKGRDRGPESCPGQPKQLSFLTPARIFNILILLRLMSGLDYQYDQSQNQSRMLRGSFAGSTAGRLLGAGDRLKVIRSQRTGQNYSAPGTSIGEAFPGSLGPLAKANHPSWDQFDRFALPKMESAAKATVGSVCDTSHPRRRLSLGAFALVSPSVMQGGL